MRWIVILSFLLLSGCSVNYTYVSAFGDVYCSTSLDKPVSVVPSLNASGNKVPLSMVP